MWCVACGAELLSGAAACWKCGKAQAPGAAPGAAVSETCEIFDCEALIEMECLVRCHRFVAKAWGSRGFYQAGQSGGFYCPDWLPERQYAGEEHAELVAHLIRNGWEPTGDCGPNWWNVKFRRGARVPSWAVPRAEKVPG